MSAATDRELARVAPQLLAAIQRMRMFCDDAEQSAKNAEPAVAVAAVLNSFAYGFANASAHIQTAMSALESARRVAMDEAAANVKDSK